MPAPGVPGRGAGPGPDTPVRVAQARYPRILIFPTLVFTNLPRGCADGISVITLDSKERIDPGENRGHLQKKKTQTYKTLKSINPEFLDCRVTSNPAAVATAWSIRLH